jgi:hypothetical protein
MSPGSPALDTQQHWWDVNGHHFTLMDIPSEIRCCIYEQVFGTNVGTHAPSNTHTLSNSPAPSVLTKFTLAGNRLFIGSSIIRANKQVYGEMIKVAWEGTWKQFYYPDRFLAFANDINPSNYNCLRRISLAFFNSQFLECLGMHDDSGDGFAAVQGPYADIGVLRTLPGLVNLNFHFTCFHRRTEDEVPGMSNDPWPMTALDALGESMGTIVSCQKVFVDWFFTLAWDKIRGIDRISFTGYVKNSTRVKWERIFLNERRLRGTHDVTDEVVAIKATLREDL